MSESTVRTRTFTKRLANCLEVQLVSDHPQFVLTVDQTALDEVEIFFSSLK